MARHGKTVGTVAESNRRQAGGKPVRATVLHLGSGTPRHCLGLTLRQTHLVCRATDQ